MYKFSFKRRKDVVKMLLMVINIRYNYLSVLFILNYGIEKPEYNINAGGGWNIFKKLFATKEVEYKCQDR